MCTRPGPGTHGADPFSHFKFIMIKHCKMTQRKHCPSFLHDHQEQSNEEMTFKMTKDHKLCLIRRSHAVSSNRDDSIASRKSAQEMICNQAIKRCCLVIQKIVSRSSFLPVSLTHKKENHLAPDKTGLRANLCLRDNFESSCKPIRARGDDSKTAPCTFC